MNCHHLPTSQRLRPISCILCRLYLRLCPSVSRWVLLCRPRWGRLSLRSRILSSWMWSVPPASGPRSIACATEPRPISNPCKAAKRIIRVSSHPGYDRFAEQQSGDQSSPKSRPAYSRRPLLIVRGGSEKQTKRKSDFTGNRAVEWSVSRDALIGRRSVARATIIPRWQDLWRSPT